LDYDGLQKNLQRLLDWSREWQMEFSIDNCKVMHIGSSNRNFRYYMENQELEVVQEEKDLGVLVINDLKVQTSVHKPVTKQTESRK